MNITFKKGVCALAFVVSCGCGFAAQASAQAIPLKLAWLNPDSPVDPYAVAAHTFADTMEEILPGRVKFSFYPNRQLGEEKEVLESLEFGTIDMGVITNAVVATIEPSYQILDLPFLFKDAKTAHDVIDGPVGQTLAANLERHGVISLGAMEGGFRNMLNNVRPVNSPDDVKSVKYRTMQNPVFIEMFRSLGGNAIPMAWGEVFTAVQQGTIDGLELPVSVISANKMYEVTKYLSLTHHTYSANHLLISKRVFNRLPKDVQAAMIEAGKVATRRERETMARNEQTVTDSLAAAGMVVNRVTDFAPFRQAVRPVYDAFAASIGPNLMKQALDAAQ